MRVVASLLLLLVCAAGPPAGAQPVAGDLLRDWQSGWDRAARGLEGVVVRESLTRTVAGPRDGIEMYTEGTLRQIPGRLPQRDVERAELNGRRVGTPARARFERRTRRAYGAAAELLDQPAPIPGILLRGADPVGPVVRDAVDGRPAWRVPLRSPRVPGQITAWFGASEERPLLRLRLEQNRENGRAVLLARYRRIDGLDVATDLETTVTVQQRRRLRTYTVELLARSTYRSHRIVR